MIVGEKQSLRVEARRFLTGLENSRIRAAGRKILGHLGQWDPWRQALTVCAFSALPSEPDILTPWPSEKKIILPRVSGSIVSLHHVEGPHCLAAGSFGILEPLAHTPPAMAKADIILVPGLAFDRSGQRLGRGGGYYDRLLEGFEGLRVGVCFEELVRERIPVESHDEGVDFLATPGGVIACARQSRRRDSGV